MPFVIQSAAAKACSLPTRILPPSRTNRATTELTLENGQSFRLDFYRLDTILAVDGLVAVLTDDGQRWLLDGQAFELVRRGGLNGEGINAEPVNLLRIDTTEIQTDLQVWDTLAYLEQNGSRQLRVLYGTDFRFISGRGNVDLFQRGNSLRPELDDEGTDTSYAEITWRREENPLSLAIDPEGMGDIRLDAATLRVMPLDGRDLSESVENIDSLLIEEADVRFVRFDGSYRTSLLDTTDIETPAEIVIEQGLSPFAENFTPQEFNNTGVQLYDYSPDVVPYQALMPYNRVNGNFYYEVTDAHVPGHTLELQWTRHYNSLAPGNQTPAYMRQVRYRAGQIGNQWRHSYQYELDVRLAPLGEMRLILPDGSVHRFRNTEANPARFRSATLNAWQIDRQDGLLGTMDSHHRRRHTLTASMKPDAYSASSIPITWHCCSLRPRPTQTPEPQAGSS